MKTYIFDTVTTVKERYYKRHIYIDRDIISRYMCKASDLETAFKNYVDHVNTREWVSISKNAVKTKQPMYRDDSTGHVEQIGYVLTGKTEFYDEKECNMKTMYIDLWVEIQEAKHPNFKEV